MIKLKGKGNISLLEFECDRCGTKFWYKSEPAQIDCPVCTPKNLSNHPIITGTSTKGVRCENCNGKGIISLVECFGEESSKNLENCPVCRGTGVVRANC